MSRTTNRIRALALSALSVAAIAGSVAAAPAAAADERPIEPSRHTCGWTTCTLYWSVERTDEFNETWKGAVHGSYALTGLVGGAGLVATGVGAPAAVALEAGLIYKAAEFEVQISQAAHDGRCLMFKYPRIHQELGWWGSVSPSNGNCD